MEQIPCTYCGDFFDPSPRHKNQTACKKLKMSASEKSSMAKIQDENGSCLQRQPKKQPAKMARDHPGLLESLSQEKARKGRTESNLTNHTEPESQSFIFGCKDEMAPVIAKMDPSKFDNFKVLGQFSAYPGDCKDGRVKS